MTQPREVVCVCIPEDEPPFSFSAIVPPTPGAVLVFSQNENRYPITTARGERIAWYLLPQQLKESDEIFELVPVSSVPKIMYLAGIDVHVFRVRRWGMAAGCANGWGLHLLRDACRALDIPEIKKYVPPQEQEEE